MVKIIKSRGKGKTRDLILLSAVTGDVIVCASKVSCKYIEDLAHKENLNIPKPMTFKEIKLKGYGEHIPGILIDDADWILQCLFSEYKIDAITMDK